MNKKSNRVPSAGTKAEKSTKVETRLPSSPTIGNTHVVCSQSSVSHDIGQELKAHFDNNSHLKAVEAEDFYVLENSVRSPDIWIPYKGKNFKDK